MSVGTEAPKAPAAAAPLSLSSTWPAGRDPLPDAISFCRASHRTPAAELIQPPGSSAALAAHAAEHSTECRLPIRGAPVHQGPSCTVMHASPLHTSNSGPALTMRCPCRACRDYAAAGACTALSARLLAAPAGPSMCRSCSSRQLWACCCAASSPPTR